MKKSNFVETEEEFNIIVDHMSKIFHLKRRLPEQVFKEEYRNFKIVDFDPMMWSDFWKVLHTCAKQAGDTEIYLLLIDPDPVNYYFKNFHRYGALNFDISATPDDYSNALRAEPPSSPADAFETNSYVWTWCGDSLKWGFYGERGGIGIGTASSSFKWSKVEGISGFNVEDALDGLVRMAFHGQESEFHDFAKIFKKNYQE